MLFNRPNFQAIAVSPRVQEQLLRIGLPKERIEIIHAFIPPALDGQPALPEAVEVFLNAHVPILSVYGFECYMVNGLDAPGFDMAVRLMSRLANDYPRAGLIILIPGAERTPERFFRLRKMVRDLGLEQRVLFIADGSDHLVTLFARSTIYLRPTVQDGDAIAVREALAFGVPVVASDAAYRPKDAVIFRSRDSQDFERVVRLVLDDLPHHRQSLVGHRPDDKYQAIVDLYRRLLRTGTLVP